MLGILSWSFESLSQLHLAFSKAWWQLLAPRRQKTQHIQWQGIAFHCFFTWSERWLGYEKRICPISWMARQTRMLPFVHVQTNWNSKLWKLQGIWSFGTISLCCNPFPILALTSMNCFKHQDWQTNNVFGLASHCGLGRGSRFYRQCFSPFHCLWKSLAWQQCQRKGWRACSTEFKATTRLKVWKTSFLLWQSSWSERKPVQVQNFEPKLQKLEGWLLLQHKSAMNFWMMTMCLNIQSRWLPQNCGNVILSCPWIHGITSQCCCMAESFCCCARAWKTRLTILRRSNQSTTAS